MKEKQEEKQQYNKLSYHQDHQDYLRWDGYVEHNDNNWIRFEQMVHMMDQWWDQYTDRKARHKEQEHIDRQQRRMEQEKDDKKQEDKDVSIATSSLLTYFDYVKKNLTS